MKYACFLTLIILLSASCRKDKTDNKAGNCNIPVEYSRIDIRNFDGQFLYVDSFWLEGKNLHLHTQGSCVSEPKNTALLLEHSPRMPSFPVYEYTLYLTDTVRNDFTMDCFATKPMTLCYSLQHLLPDSGKAAFYIKHSPTGSSPVKTFTLAK